MNEMKSRTPEEVVDLWSAVTGRLADDHHRASLFDALLDHLTTDDSTRDIARTHNVTTSSISEIKLIMLRGTEDEVIDFINSDIPMSICAKNIRASGRGLTGKTNLVKRHTAKSMKGMADSIREAHQLGEERNLTNSIKAKIAGVHVQTTMKYNRLLKSGRDDLIDKFHEGEISLTSADQLRLHDPSVEALEAATAAVIKLHDAPAVLAAGLAEEATPAPVPYHVDLENRIEVLEGNEDKYIAANNILADRIEALENSTTIAGSLYDRIGKLEARLKRLYQFFSAFPYLDKEKRWIGSRPAGEKIA